MVVFDATMLLLAMRPDKVKPPIDTKTGLPVDYVEQRVNALIRQLEKDKIKIIIPTPALSELLVCAGEDTASLIEILQRNYVFKIESFDTLAAIEVAMMARKDIKGDKRSGVDSCTLTKAKVKYDRQIVATAIVHKATEIYSDDGHISDLAKTANINIIKLEDLPVPMDAAQGTLNFEEWKIPKELAENEHEETREDTEGIEV